MTFIDEFRAVASFLSQASVEDIIAVVLFALVCLTALLFEALWLRERRYRRGHFLLEKNENTAKAELIAKATLRMRMNVARRELSGKLARKASSIAFWIKPSTHQVSRPVPTDTTHAMKSSITLSEYRPDSSARQSQLTSDGEGQSIKGRIPAFGFCFA
jgi:hypothetical protein